MGKKVEDIVIDRDDIKIRKQFAPPVKVHNPKKAYQRKPKFQDEELEEGLDWYLNEENLDDIMED